MLKQRQRLKKILLHVLCAVCGAVMINCKILSLPAPLAAILPAIMPFSCGAAALLGTAASGLIFLGKNALPIAAAAAASLFSRLRINGSSERALATLSAFPSGTYLMCASALGAFSGEGAFELFMSGVLAALLFLSLYVFSSAAALLRSKKKIPPKLAIFCVGAAVCALCPINLGAASLGGVFAVYCSLAAGMSFGPGAACAVSAAAALGAGLYSPAAFSDFSLLLIPSLLCGGLFGSVFAAAAVMISAPVIPAFLFGSDSAFGLLADSAIASALFVFTSQRSAALLRKTVLLGEKRLASKAAGLMSYETERVAENLMRSAQRPLSVKKPLSDAVYSRVCVSCRGESCPENNGGSLSRLDGLAPPVELGDVYKALPGCSKAAEVRNVSRETLRRQEYFLSEESERRRSQRLCAQLLFASGSAISDAGAAVKRGFLSDRLLSERLERLLKKSGVSCLGCTVFKDGGAEVVMSASARINALKIASAVSEITSLEYSEPERFDLSGGLLLRLSPKPEFSVEIGTFGLAAGDGPSGDFDFSFESGGCFYAVISDGMGVGAAASAASSTLSEMICGFIRAGFSVETAMRLSSPVLNCTLPEECFATADVLKLDRRTGSAEIYKAGGCESYLISDGGESVISAGGYPIGILDFCDISVRRFKVSDSAAIVMLTDGALGVDCERLGPALRLPSQDLAEALLKSAKPKNPVQIDDRTVSVIKIERKPA